MRGGTSGNLLLKPMSVQIGDAIANKACDMCNNDRYVHPSRLSVALFGESWHGIGTVQVMCKL